MCGDLLVVLAMTSRVLYTVIFFFRELLMDQSFAMRWNDLHSCSHDFPSKDNIIHVS